MNVEIKYHVHCACMGGVFGIIMNTCMCVCVHVCDGAGWGGGGGVGDNSLHENWIQNFE